MMDNVEQRVCESYRDCELPTDSHDTHDNEVSCPNCRRVWEYSNGWFEPTDRFNDADTDQ